MKKFPTTLKPGIISTLILLSSIATQVKTHFIRGAIYKNEKTGQIIVLVGDLHAVSKGSEESFINGSQKSFFYQTKKQRSQLIEEIIKIDKKSSLVLVEGGENSDIDKDNVRIQKSKKFVNNALAKFGIDDQNFSPIYFLRPDLLKSNVNVQDVDPRSMEDMLEQEIPFLINLKASGENPEQQIFIEDIINEIEKNITNLKKHALEIKLYKKNYSEKEYASIENYFNESIMYVEKNFPQYLEFLNECKPLKINKLHLNDVKKLFGFFRLMKEATTYHKFVFFDANLFHAIIKNGDKKIITICAGSLHTSRIEYLISDLGYKLIKEIGIKNITKEACYDSKKLDQELGWVINKKPDFINMKELFEGITVENTPKIGLNTRKIDHSAKKPEMNTPVINTPETNTPEISTPESKKLGENNYNLSPEQSKFLEKVCNILIESKEPMTPKSIYRAILKANKETENENAKTQKILNK